ncbi:ATP-binding protein [Mycolicibacterium xanthum]|uniref:ATP-binding protein n=1 Tax=Mycolicibacterium xanthum TaxID=2796469 RepID=UPI002102CFDF|nr:adenylate/guanylate cyclase domain-containing protein [Mycolicibacterium xanthum]
MDRAVTAINRGDQAAASALAGQVLEIDRGNVEAEDLLTAPGDAGEIRRLTILFADLVGSTELSARVEPETYRMLVGSYRDLVLGVVDRFEGHIGSIKGDGLLAVFGHPTAHEDDVRRAVLAGLEITREVAQLSERAQRRFGVDVGVRVGVHRGLVYLDVAQDDIYGMAANLAERVSGLAEPGTVVVSDAVEPLIRDAFELQARPPARVKGVEGLITCHLVVGERADAARVGVGRGPLVGRERELARLQRSWACAQAGTLHIPGVVFRGEPGIGKSRLVAAAGELAQASGAPVVELVGSPFHTDVGLHPVRSLIERRCGITRATEAGQRLRLLQAEVRACGLNPETAIPVLAAVLGISAEAGYEPVAAEGRQLYELIAAGVHEYLLACVGGSAALVVVEDVQWFDTSTLEVVDWLLRAAQGRLLVVIAGRPGSWLSGGWPVKVVDLDPLTDTQADELITALDPSLLAEDRAAVVARCDGVPFYIEQLVRGVREAPADGSGETRVPDSLYEPLFAQLQMRANAVPVIEAASVIGRDVDRGLLCSVVDLGQEEVDLVVDELEDALVLEPWGTEGWRFRHELLREVAAEVAPPSVRRRLHARVADALAHGVDRGGPDWGLVATHYEHAQRFDAAAFAYQQASAAARRRGALAEARTDLTLALAQLDRALPAAGGRHSQLTLQLERGFLNAAIEGYQTRAAVGDFERCLQLCGTNLGDDELVVTLFALAGYYAVRADLRRAATVLETLRVGVEHGRAWLQPVIGIGFGVVAWLRGEFDAAGSHLKHAAENLAAANHDEIDEVWIQPDEPVATAHIYLTLVALVRGDLPWAEAELARVAHRAQRLDFPQGPYARATACYVEIWLRIEAGQLDPAAALAADLTEQAERHGFDALRLLGATQQAAVSAVTSLSSTQDLDPTALSAHIATMTTFVDTLRTVGLNVFAAFPDSVVARLLMAAGQPDQARARLDTALQLGRETGMHYYDAELLRLRAHTQTDPDARRADLTASIELAYRQGAHLFGLRASLDDFELRGQAARTAVVDAVGRMPANSAFPELRRARAALESTDPLIG